MGIRTAKVALSVAVLLGGPGTDGSQPLREPSTELPMQLVRGYLIVVEGSIGDLHGLRFLLDTGVSRSVIDRHMADKMALPRWTASLINFDKTLEIESCEVPEISFGAEHVSKVKMTVADLGYLGTSGPRIDAVVGWDLLGRKSFRLDFARKLVVFEPKEHRGNRFAPVRPNGWFLMVETYVDGTPVWMVADTGAQGVTFYQERLGSVGARYTVRGDAIGQSLGGAISARVADVSRLRLGAQDLDRTVHLIHAPLSGAPEGIAGYLGFATLNAREIDFDLEKKEIRWVN